MQWKETILRSFRQPFNKVSVNTVHTQSISITMYRSVDHYYYVLWSPHQIRKSITLLPSYDFPFGRYFHYIIITSCSVIMNSQNTIIARVHDIVITSRCVYNKSVHNITKSRTIVWYRSMKHHNFQVIHRMQLILYTIVHRIWLL